MTGTHEIHYEINPLQKHSIQEKPWLVPFPNIEGDRDLIIVTKTKNFTNSHRITGYQYGFKDINPVNQIGSFFTRSTSSSIILSGNLLNHTIQSILSATKIIVSPTLNNVKKAMVGTQINITLTNISTLQEAIPEITKPKNVKNLHYVYEQENLNLNNFEENSNSFEDTDIEMNNLEIEDQIKRNKSLFDTKNMKSNFNLINSTLGQVNPIIDPLSTNYIPQENQIKKRLRNLLLNQFDKKSNSIKYQSNKILFRRNSNLEKIFPRLNTYKIHSQSNNQQISSDILQSIKKFCLDISRDLQNPETITQQQTLTKYTTLTDYIRTLSIEDMHHISGHLNDLKSTNLNAWFVLRDALAESGTEAALNIIASWLESDILVEELPETLETLADNARRPTYKFLAYFLELIKKIENINASGSVLLSYANLIRKAHIECNPSKRIFLTLYFSMDEYKEIQNLVKTFVQMMATKLKKSVQDGDSAKILLYTRVLGNLGHRKIISIFKPYLKRNIKTSRFQRVNMILALDKLSEIEPENVKNVVYNVYLNFDEEEDVRVAAVYLIFKTNPSGDMLQRMAERTNFDKSEKVNAAVKSGILGAVKLLSSKFNYL